jgi:UDP-glucose:(heptosyl)LPS alpha-1,3-glucosyltransferase
MSTPKVAIMLPKLSRYGGVEQFGYRLAEYLAREFDVTFICARQEHEAPAGVRVVRIGRPPGKFCKMIWFALGAELARRKGGFDVSIGLGKSLRQDLLRLSGGPTKPFWDYSIRAYEAGWQRELKRLARILSPANQLGRLVEWIQIRSSRVLVANSEFVRDITIEAFPFLDPAAVRVIYNQPDLERFRPFSAEEKQLARKRLNLPADVQLIGTAGTIFRRKGMHILVAAMKLLPPTFHLAVAGIANSGTLATLIRQQGLADRVHLLGRVHDIPTFYATNDIFVLNTFCDACANAVLEALACALPTISTASNGSSAFLIPEAVLPDPSNAEDLARRILALASHGSTARPGFAPLRGLEPYAELIRSLA